ncbi:MAG: hypothetical protein DSM106950_01795 [Stigonema ocellatum SAG 48.90 = DSM 106950]|nr:hypothetical protein [Stigonema ocellatum SAG 48.90 = DSM 106950]
MGSGEWGVGNGEWGVGNGVKRGSGGVLLLTNSPVEKAGEGIFLRFVVYVVPNSPLPTPLFPLLPIPHSPLPSSPYSPLLQVHH